MALTKVSAGVLNIDDLYGFRNRIINGDMRIDQRNAGAAVTISAAQNIYTVDRWFGNGENTDGVFTVDQVTDAPVGFTNSAKITVTTADTSIGSSQFYIFRQYVEGNNAADLGFGTANAKTVTASFWVRSSLTGTFSGAVNNATNDRNYPFTYSISAADTWEYKTVTIPGDTSGTWLTDNSRGVGLTFSLGCGSGSSATAGSWTSTSPVFGATGATNLISTNGATFYITGVQLEVGSTATPFERRQFGTELALCQRYYFNINGGDSGGFTTIGIGGATSTTNSRNLVQHPVVMRAQPTVSSLGGGTFSIQAFDSTGSGSTIFSTSQPSRFTSYINFTTSGITAYRPTAAQLENTTSYTVGIQFSAEL